MILDKTLFKDLYFGYCDRLIGYARSCGFDEASCEDIVQQAFLRLWEKYSGQDMESPESLLFVLVRNLCLDKARHMVVHRSIFQEIPDNEYLEYISNKDFQTGINSESLTIAKELEIEISRAIDSLSPQCRNVFRLSRIKEMKNKEVAQFLGITEKAVEKQISKALKQIRGILNKKFRV